MRLKRPLPLENLRTLAQVDRSQVDALATEIGADIARTQKVALDVLALGPRLSPEAAALARSMLLASVDNKTATPVSIAQEVPAAFAKDIAACASPIEATLLLSSHAEQMARLTSGDSLELVAGQLLAAAKASIVLGDPKLPEGDPWSAREWPAAVGSNVEQLTALLDGRGLRPPGLGQRVSDAGADWWSALSSTAPLFRAPPAAKTAIGGVTIDSADLYAALASIGEAVVQSPVSKADVERALD